MNTRRHLLAAAAPLLAAPLLDPAGGARAAAPAPPGGQAVPAPGGQAAPAPGGQAAPAPGGQAAPAGELLLVMEKNARGLGWYDPSDGRRVAGVELPEFPHEFVLDSTGRYAFVGHYGLFNSASTEPGGHSVVVVDLHERRVARMIDLRPYNRLHGMAIDRQDRLYVLSEGQNTLLTLAAPLTATAPSGAAATGGIKTHLFSLSRDGERAFVTGLLSGTVSLVRPHDASAAPVVLRSGDVPEGNWLSPDERTLYVGNRRSGTLVAIDAEAMRVRDTRRVGGDPLRVYAMPDGRLLLTDLERKTVTLLTATMEPIATVTFAAAPTAVSWHPSRPLAYVSLISDRMAILDLERREVVGEFPTRAGTDVSRIVPAR